jgi:NitT/TauT family transport system permease protein
MKTKGAQEDLSEKLACALFLLGLVLVWQVAHMLALLPSYVFPSPTEVASRLSDMYSEGLLLPSIVATVQRTFIGFLAAAAAGLLLGVSMSVSKIIKAGVRPLLLGVQTLPTVAWAPLSLIFFGLKPAGIYFVILASSLPAVALATFEAIRRVPRNYLEVAQTMGLSRREIAWRVELPAALPHITTGLKLGWTFAWHGAVSAELIKSTVGLGYLLHMGREVSDISQVLGIMLVTVAMGYLIDLLIFRTIEKRALRKWGGMAVVSSN